MRSRTLSLQQAGIPMRNRITSGILHWKVAIFAGQGQIEFAGANYAPFEMTPDTPWVNYTDEVVYFTNDSVDRPELHAEVRRPVDEHDGICQLRQRDRSR